MRLLLDTQVFIWAVIDSPRLTPEARSVMTGAEATFVSAASIWKIAMKGRLGRLPPGDDRGDQRQRLSGASDQRGALRRCHDLPRYHKDPFDHLLLAQAIAEPLRLLSADPLLPRYSDLVIPV